mmetsp:Transcript_125596/g.349720  ORF Transcript_125596/g.349720 Transcript_125596/m.349720 type:complete len:275 (-) Transcript_125596:899-1723(-)
MGTEGVGALGAACVGGMAGIAAGIGAATDNGGPPGPATFSTGREAGPTSGAGHACCCHRGGVTALGVWGRAAAASSGTPGRCSASAPSSSSAPRAGGGVGLTARPVVSAMPRKRSLRPFPTRGPASAGPALRLGFSISFSSRMLDRKASERRFCGTAFTNACSKVMYRLAFSMSPMSASIMACANLNGWSVGHNASASPQRTAYSKASDSCSATGSNRNLKFFGLRCSTPSKQTRLEGASTGSRLRSAVKSRHTCAPKMSPWRARPLASTSRNL